MKKFSFVIFSISLTACVSTYPSLELTGTVERDRYFEEVAEEIYDIANQCWTKPSNIILWGTYVQSRVTLEGIEIYAGFSPNPQQPQQLVVQFTVKEESDSTSLVEVYEREMPMIGKGRYREEAYMWAEGNYKCLE